MKTEWLYHFSATGDPPTTDSYWGNKSFVDETPFFGDSLFKIELLKSTIKNFKRIPDSRLWDDKDEICKILRKHRLTGAKCRGNEFIILKEVLSASKIEMVKKVGDGWNLLDIIYGRRIT